MSDICIIGNDNRMTYVSEYFYDLGYDITRSIDNINNASFIIFSPVVNEKTQKEVLDKISTNNVLFIGKVSKEFIATCTKNKIKYYQYLNFNEFVSENAILTAKGIVKEAINSEAVLEESKCLVTGYGFCGKAIAKELIMHNANVDVLVRKESLKQEIMKNNYGFISFNHINETDINKYSYIFNTIPALVITRSIIDRLSNNIMIYDIASGEGGIDYEYCKSKNIFSYQSLGIPGRLYPKQAGEALAKAIYSKIISDYPLE